MSTGAAKCKVHTHLAFVGMGGSVHHSGERHQFWSHDLGGAVEQTIDQIIEKSLFSFDVHPCYFMVWFGVEEWSSTAVIEPFKQVRVREKNIQVNIRWIWLV